MDRNTLVGRTLVISILLIIFVPLTLLSVKEPVKVGLPTLVFALTGVYVWLHNRNQARRDATSTGTTADRRRR